jgi:DNA-binding SARP family transcriptional activator/predicted ATPase
VDLRLSISVLGAPAITLEGVPVRGIVSRKAAALVYYLAATARPHTRDALGGLLWGEASEAQAQKNLRDVISNLRRLLGPYLAITRETLSFPPDAGLVDSRRFEALLGAVHRPRDACELAPLHDALALYHGDFLSGFSIADAPAFDEWALIERERLRRLALGALHRLAALAAQEGAYEEGIAAAAQLIAMDPTREEAHRDLMLLLALAGQRGAALAQYEACRRALNDELGIDPDEETEALYRRILDGRPHAGRPAPAPPTLRPRPHADLPAPLTAFIGREAMLGQLVARLRAPDCRLATITGTGGVGKTRLALEAARRLLPAGQPGEPFAHGIAFVPLAAVEAAHQDAQLFHAALARRVGEALRFTFSAPEAPQVQLAHYLREKDLLLVLDNCEHLPVADFTVELLERAPRLKVLATSRARLHVRGEQVVELDGLPFPSGAEAGALAQPDDYAAMRLFRYNARAVNPRLDWTPATSAAAARICELVAGLPLGIELAASLVRLMPCEEIAREIAASLEFLQSSQCDLPERHQSLRAVFEHSWNLLCPDEARVLRQLSVFRGGWSRAAAEQIADASFPLLAALVDNSLVRLAADRRPGEARYEMLELVRQYAADKLAEARRGGDTADVFERHGRYYLGMLRQRKAELRGSRQQAALAEINLEIENIRAAWRWAVTAARVDLIEQAAESLFFFYEMRSWFSEGVEAFAQAAALLAALHAAAPTEQTRRVWGKLLARQGWCAFQVGRQAEARALLEQSLAIARPLGADAEIVFPLNYLASVAYYSGDYDLADQLAEEALRASRACGDRHGLAVAKTVLGQIAYLVGRYEEARRYSSESLAIERELGNRWGMVFALISLGRVDQALGAYAEARRSFQEGLAIRQAFGDTRGIALCLNYLGDTAQAMGDDAEARRRYQESLRLFKEIGNQAGAATSLTKLGYNALARYELAAAQRHFHDALRMAWSAQAIPRALEAIAGIAMAHVDDAPEQAYRLADLVFHHPAAVQESRDRAVAVLAQLVSGDANLPAQPSPGGQAAQPLGDVVAALLGGWTGDDPE